MTLPNVEKVDTNIILVSGSNASLNVSQEAIAKILRDPMIQGIGQPPLQIDITSLRDQILIRLVQDRYIFEDKSDDKPGGGRLPEVVYAFVKMLSEQNADTFKAYGLNFTVTFDAKGDGSASEVVAQRYLKLDALQERGGINVRGAGVQLYYDHTSGAKCNLRVEPRLGEVESPTFFAHGNYHFDLPDLKMPPAETMKTTYLGLWPQFLELLEKLFVR